MILDGVIEAAGMVVIAGPEGVGKTVAMVSLFAKAAHLCRPDDSLRPRLRRRVAYIAEDTRQVRRVLASILRFGDTGCSA